MTNERVSALAKAIETAVQVAKGSEAPWPHERAYFALERQFSGDPDWAIVDAAAHDYLKLDFQGWARWKQACTKTGTAVN